MIREINVFHCFYTLFLNVREGEIVRSRTNVEHENRSNFNAREYTMGGGEKQNLEMVREARARGWI